MTEQIVYPLIGGLLIGLATSLMLMGLGRIAGISGIFSTFLSLPQKEDFWRYNFIAGIIFGGILMYFISPQFFNYEIKATPLRIISAGLLVGFGTRLGSGCTSGHGVCGLSRLAKRSLVATLTFMATGIIVVAIEEFLL